MPPTLPVLKRDSNAPAHKPLVVAEPHRDILHVENDQRGWRCPLLRLRRHLRLFGPVIGGHILFLEVDGGGSGLWLILTLLLKIIVASASIILSFVVPSALRATSMIVLVVIFSVGGRRYLRDIRSGHFVRLWVLTVFMLP